MAQNNQDCVKKLKTMREEVKWEIEEERREFLQQLYPLIKKWEGQLPDLRDIFCSEEIDWLLVENIKNLKEFYLRTVGDFIKFVTMTGYKDEPDVDEDGNPSFRRTTAVHWAPKGCTMQYMVRRLFKIYDRFDVNYTDEESGLTHFHVACQYDCVDVVEKFLEFGQDPDLLVPETGDSPLHLALKYARNKVVELLLRHGANPNLADTNGFTPVHIICKRGKNYKKDLQTFFEINDANNQTVCVNLQDKSGWTPLHTVLYNGNMEILILLFRRGANPNLANNNGSTPLHLICKDPNDRIDCAEKFFKINKTVQIDVPDNAGNTPLHWAVHRRNKYLVKLLLERGANPNMANKNESTPLHVICKDIRGGDFLGKILFKISNEMHQSVQIDVRDKSGRTPLQMAMINLLICSHTINELLNRGADVSGVVFPRESHFDECLDKIRDNVKFDKASRALALVVRLEKRGYEFNRSDVLTVMKFISECKLFQNSTNFDLYWRTDETYVRKAQNLTINSTLSLYDFVRLPFEEAMNLLTVREYFELVNSNKFRRLPIAFRKAFIAYLLEIISRGFCRRWALKFFLSLTQLPIMCCDMIIDQLTNVDLIRICQAAEITAKK